jgi:hypothetical protein
MLFDNMEFSGLRPKGFAGKKVMGYNPSSVQLPILRKKLRHINYPPLNSLVPDSMDSSDESHYVENGTQNLDPQGWTSPRKNKHSFSATYT